MLLIRRLNAYDFFPPSFHFFNKNCYRKKRKSFYSTIAQVKVTIKEKIPEISKKR